MGGGENPTYSLIFSEMFLFLYRLILCKLRTLKALISSFVDRQFLITTEVLQHTTQHSIITNHTDAHTIEGHTIATGWLPLATTHTNLSHENPHSSMRCTVATTSAHAQHTHISSLTILTLYRIAGIIRGGIIFALFTVEFHPRKINPRNIAGE